MKIASKALRILVVIAAIGGLRDGPSMGQPNVDGSPTPREVLIADDVTPHAPPVWCGPDVLVVSGERTGLRWISIATRRPVAINRTGVPVTCTPDGRWVIYSEPKTSRMVDIDPLSPRWDPAVSEMGVRDYWRFNRDDGRRERFAVAGGGGEWSPDGTKLLFEDGRPRVMVASGPPRWNLVFSSRHWAPSAGLEAVWLADSRHILIVSGGEFWLENVEEGRPAKQLAGARADSFSPRVDRLDRIYLMSSGHQPRGRRDLLRCRIEGDVVQCDTILKRPRSITAFDISPDGSAIVLGEEGADCLLLWTNRGKEGRCVVTGTELSGFRLSPTSTHLAFTRERRNERRIIGKGPHYRSGRSDLFVVELPRSER